MKRFAIVYDGATHELKRLIDTSDDPDDSHLARAKSVLQPGEVIEAFPIDMLPVADVPVAVAVSVDDGKVQKPTTEEMKALGDAAAAERVKNQDPANPFKVAPRKMIPFIGKGEVL